MPRSAVTVSTDNCTNLAQRACGHAERFKRRWEECSETLERVLLWSCQFLNRSHDKEPHVQKQHDAAIRWPTSSDTIVVDVAFRCPDGSRYGGGVAASPTEAACEEKHQLYKPSVAAQHMEGLSKQDATRSSLGS